MTAAEAWLWLEPTEGVRQPHSYVCSLRALSVVPSANRVDGWQEENGLQQGERQLTLGAPCGPVQGFARRGLKGYSITRSCSKHRLQKSSFCFLATILLCPLQGLPLSGPVSISGGQKEGP